MKKTGILILGLSLLFLVSCSKLENQTHSGTKLVLNSLTDSQGAPFLQSDVESGTASDLGIALLSAFPLNLVTGTAYQAVVVDQIDVTFTRVDGHNVEGVDVPYGFTQVVNILVPADGEGVSVPFVVIRDTAKLVSPLLDVYLNNQSLQLVANVTVHGVDVAGHRVAPVTGSFNVWCANWATAN